MAFGKKTGGRQKGSLNKITCEEREAVAASGLTPLDYMLSVLRDEKQPAARRDDMAKAAAPYVHARLSSAEVKSETTVTYMARVPEKDATSDQWQARNAGKLNTSGKPNPDPKLN
jgi:hypothetical protein